MAVGTGEKAGSLGPDELLWLERASMLDSAPGIDPLAALHADRESDVPRAGYLIRAYVDPDQEAAVDLFRYPEGGLEIRKSDLHYSEEGSNMRANLRGHAETRALCTRRINAKEEYVVYDMTLPVQDAAPTPLIDGLHMMVQKRPYNFGTGHGISLRTYKSAKATDPFARTQIVRTVAASEEAYEVCVTVGRSMGLDGDALDVFSAEMADQLDKIGPEQPRHIPSGALGALAAKEQRPL